MQNFCLPPSGNEGNHTNIADASAGGYANLFLCRIAIVYFEILIRPGQFKLDNQFTAIVAMATLHEAIPFAHIIR